MEFIPETEDKKIKVPFYDDVKGRSDEGWSGHATGKSFGGLKSEISAALGRLGAMVTGFQRGQFRDEVTGLMREAVRIHYTVANEHGELWPGQIDVAALPVDRKSCRDKGSYENKIEKSLCMALYMTLTALQGSWNMRMLSPGYSPLMPWMLAPNSEGKTFSQLWESSLERNGITALLPEPTIEGSDEAIEGEFQEV